MTVNPHAEKPEPEEEDFRRCDRLVGELRARLPRKINGRALSATAKVPFNAALLDGGLSYRIVELVEAAIELVGSRRLVAANLLARGALETAALHFYATKYVVAACDSGDIKEAQDVLYRALVGSHAYGNGTVKPINVLTAIDHVDKQFPGVRGFYDQQSEFAHPNWWGAHGAYAGSNQREDFVSFDQDYTPGIQASEVGRGIAMALTIFDYSQRRLRNRLVPFAKCCDAWIAKHGG